MNFNLQMKVTQPAFAPMFPQVADALLRCTKVFYMNERRRWFINTEVAFCREFQYIELKIGLL